MSIAFFDSGIGGITVLHEAMKQLPHEDFLYFADTLHVPYGPKPKNEVKSYIFESVRKLMRADVKALVIACNTATSIAISELREMYRIPVIGMEPAVKPAVEMNRYSGRRVLVLATPLTLSETKYHALVNEIDDASIVDSLPLPELVQYCEGLEFSSASVKQYLAERLAPYDLEKYGTVVLGCTHYPFYRHLLKELLPREIAVIDGSVGTVKHLKRQLEKRGQLSQSGQSEVVFRSSSGDQADILKMERALHWYSETYGRDDAGVQ